MERTGNWLSGLISSRVPGWKAGMRKRKPSLVKIDLEIKIIALAGIHEIANSVRLWLGMASTQVHLTNCRSGVIVLRILDDQRRKRGEPEKLTAVRIPLFKLFRRSNMNAATQFNTLHHVILECFQIRNTIAFLQFDHSDLNQQQIDLRSNCTVNLNGNTVK